MTEKVHKLEFLLADALDKSVIQSSHVVESSPIIAEELQLLQDNLTTDIGCEGNLFLDKLLQYKSGLKQMMEKTSEKILKVRGLKEQGSSAYLIEVGGSSYMLAAMEVYQELPLVTIKQDQNSNNEEDIVEISTTTGIMVDPVYNVKFIRRMLHEMNTNPGRFKGGVFGLYDGRMDPLVTLPVLGVNNVVCWESANDPMPF
ncbi:hypothetical protein pdam_00020625, partial [Pocillopora damicornis]